MLASARKTNAKLLRDLPHTMFTRYYFSEPNLDAHNSIGHLDMIESNSSTNSQHGSIMLLNLGQTESLAVQADPSVGGQTIGNHLIAASYTNSGSMVALDSPLLLSNTTNNDMVAKSVMVTRNRVPDPAQIQRRGTSSLKLHLPNMAITGWKINLQFRPISMVDNIVTVKLVRRTGTEPVAFNSWREDSYKDLNIICNSSITDGRHYDTLYSHTFVLKALSTLNKGTARPHNISKSVRCNLSRRTLRKVYDPSTALIGAMSKPHFAIAEPDASYGVQVQMNQCYLVIFSKVKDDKFMVAYEKTTAVDPTLQYATTTHGVKEQSLLDVSTPTTVLTDYSKFKVGGSVTQFNRCASYAQQII